MTDIPLHPSVIAEETEESLAATATFFVAIGLMKEGDRFIQSDAGIPLDSEDLGPLPEELTSSCRENCRAAYEIARLACGISSSVRSCRRKAEAAYNVCIALCG